MRGSRITAGLDVGTSKVSVVVAEVQGGCLHILGIGTTPSAGIRKGEVVDIHAAAESIRRAVAEAEALTKVEIGVVTAGISGSHLRLMRNTGSVRIKGREVGHADIAHALEQANHYYVPLEREVLHVIPAGFSLDGLQGISNPHGMSGRMLEAQVLVVSAELAPVRNLVKCCAMAGLDVAGIVAKPVATASSTLTENEKESGSFLVEVGGGSTDIAFFRKGILRSLAIIPIGGAHMTNDLSVVLRLSHSEAERVKLAFGASTMDELSDPNEEISIDLSGGGKAVFPRRYVIEVLNPRCEELIEMIGAEIRNSHGQKLAAGGIIMSGGTSLLRGFGTLASETLRMPVRIGTPFHEHGFSDSMKMPQFCTGTGIVRFCTAEEIKQKNSNEAVGSLLYRMKDWMKNVLT